MDELEYLEKPIRVIGRYALYGRLAAGGMATVHFGRLLGPAGFSRTVAIKRLHPQFAKDPEFVAMFLDEARLAARIQHPNVVATVDVVAMSEELFLVMDYIRGESFSRLLRASRKRGIEVSIPVIASVIVGMLHGLHAAHEAKDEQGRPLSVVHRDISPQNVLVGVDGVARVLDFGVAKASARVQVTRDGQMKGKLSYMAPEQLKGRGVDRRTDLFAAGIVFWEALTGRRLFDAEDPADVLHMITTEEIPPPSAVTPSVSRVLDEIVMKALTRDANGRFQTARAFAIAVEEAIPLASAREVGEWVERVAGETLLNRERAVAEIEATSSVTDLTALESEDVSSAPAPKEVALEPERDPGMWEEAPTNVIDPARLVMEDAARTRVQVPRPASLPAVQRLPAIPIEGAPRSQRAGGVRPKTGPSRSQPPLGTLRGLAPPKPPSSRPPASVARPEPPSLRAGSELPKAPATTLFDDENETTTIFGSDRQSPPANPSPVFDDDNETTSVFEPSAAGKLLSHATLPSYATPTRPRNTRPPVFTAAQRASVRTAPPTVIVQEDTPAALERRPSAWSSSSVFPWSKQWSALRTVVVAATATGIVAGVILMIAGPRAPGAEPAAPAAANTAVRPAPADPAPPSPPPPVAPEAPAPAAPPDAVASKADDVAPRAVTAPAKRTRRSAPAPRMSLEEAAASTESSALPEAPPEPAPPAKTDEEDELLANPYSARAAEASAGAPKNEPPPARPKAAQKSARDCKKPYYLDSDGIRRVKPECL